MPGPELRQPTPDELAVTQLSVEKNPTAFIGFAIQAAKERTAGSAAAPPPAGNAAARAGEPAPAGARTTEAGIVEAGQNLSDGLPGVEHPGTPQRVVISFEADELGRLPAEPVPPPGPATVSSRRGGRRNSSAPAAQPASAPVHTGEQETNAAAPAAGSAPAVADNQIEETRQVLIEQKRREDVNNAITGLKQDYETDNLAHARQYESILLKLLGVDMDENTQTAYRLFDNAGNIITERNNILDTIALAPEDVLSEFLAQTPVNVRGHAQALFGIIREIIRLRENNTPEEEMQPMIQQRDETFVNLNIAMLNELGINPQHYQIERGRNKAMNLPHLNDKNYDNIAHTIELMLSTRNEAILDEYPQYIPILSKEIDFLRTKLEAAGLMLHTNPETGKYEIIKVNQPAPAAAESIPTAAIFAPIPEPAGAQSPEPTGEQILPVTQPAAEAEKTRAQRRAAILEAQPSADLLIKAHEAGEAEDNL